MPMSIFGHAKAQKLLHVRLVNFYSVFLLSFLLELHFLTMELKYWTWPQAIILNNPMVTDWKITSVNDEGPMPEQRLVNMSPSVPLLLKNFPFRASSTRVLKFVLKEIVIAHLIVKLNHDKF